jgi:hypothetical protein
LAIGKEIRYVGCLCELCVLEGYSVEGAEHDVVGKTHLGCDVDCCF